MAKTWADNGKTWADNGKNVTDNGKNVGGQWQNNDRDTIGTWPGHSGNTAEPGGNMAGSQLVMTGS